jgi:hypothetical protein
MAIREKIERGEKVLEVWLDQTYVNQYHVSPMAWYFDDMTVRRGNKGRRYIILHAGG